MDKNLIKNVVTGIEFTEESKQRIFDGFDGIERKKTLKEKIYMKRITTGIVVTAMIFMCFFMNIMLKDNATITVYAMTQDGNEKSSILKPEHKEILKLMETPVGNGYIFQIDIPKDYTYECKSLEKENSIFTIYQNGENIYWIPGSNTLGQIYNTENEKLTNNSSRYVNECEFENPPRQIEFAKMYLTNVVTGKRYIKKLVEDGIVDGWDDPRLVTIAALRRRGYTPESLRMFVDLVGVSKANSSVDYAMLEYCIREDLKLKRPRMMAVLDPVKLVIDNYPEGQTEMLSIPNNLENPEMGEREVPFSRELYIEREDFMENPPKKYFRLFPGNEVRLMGAYFVTCTGVEKDENGNVTVIHCTYDPETKSGSGFTGRKVKGTIHWVSVPTAGKVECRLYENIVDEEKGKLNADGTLNLNPNSKTVTTAYVEPKLMEAKAYDSFQFMRNGYYCVDCKDSEEGKPVYNRIVSLKSSFKLPK